MGYVILIWIKNHEVKPHALDVTSLPPRTQVIQVTWLYKMVPIFRSCTVIHDRSVLFWNHFDASCNRVHIHKSSWPCCLVDCVVLYDRAARAYRQLRKMLAKTNSTVCPSPKTEHFTTPLKTWQNFADSTAFIIAERLKPWFVGLQMKKMWNVNILTEW